MGKRGPAKTPTEVLKKKGSWRGKARAKKEPSSPSANIRVPKEMTKDARKVWRQMLPKLQTMRVMTEADVNALARYCELLVRWWKANDFLQEHGDTYPIYETDAHGNRRIKYVQQFPQVSIVRNLSATLLRLEQEFGLTPAARASLDVTASKDDTPDFIEQLFNQQNRRMLQG